MNPRLWLAACLVVAAPLPTLASGGASGTFSLDGVTFKVADAFAYERKAEFGDGMAIRVRLSERPLDRKALDSVIDIAGELDRQRGEGGRYVDLEFGKDGAYSGASYSLGGRTNCGWCSDGGAAAKSAVTRSGGSLKGSMRLQPADYMDGKGPAISLDLDLPVASLAGATPLPASGGEPAKALAACREVVKKQDKAALHAACFAPDDDRMAETANVSDEGFWMIALYDRASLKLEPIEIGGGRTRGEWAELWVKGKGADGQRKGSVFLRRGPQGWRYDHESLGYDY